MRKNLRKTLQLLSLLAFPVTMNFFSPYVIVEGASKGVVNGSFLLFGTLLVSALVLGRSFCSWLCPGGCLQDLAAPMRPRPWGGGWRDAVKYVLWAAWLTLIAAVASSAGGYREVSPLFMTWHGVSIHHPAQFVVYFTIVGAFLALALGLGRRAACHSVCWMAPFMVAGRKASNALRLPAVRLAADPTACVQCGACRGSCPMSLDVPAMVARGDTEAAECILCGTCAEGCRRNALALVWTRR
jgi:polyferredoxin